LKISFLPCLVVVFCPLCLVALPLPEGNRGRLFSSPSRLTLRRCARVNCFFRYATLQLCCVQPPVFVFFSISQGLVATCIGLFVGTRVVRLRTKWFWKVPPPPGQSGMATTSGTFVFTECHPTNFSLNAFILSVCFPVRDLYTPMPHRRVSRAGFSQPDRRIFPQVPLSDLRESSSRQHAQLLLEGHSYTVRCGPWSPLPSVSFYVSRVQTFLNRFPLPCSSGTEHRNGNAFCHQLSAYREKVNRRNMFPDFPLPLPA